MYHKKWYEKKNPLKNPGREGTAGNDRKARKIAGKWKQYSGWKSPDFFQWIPVSFLCFQAGSWPEYTGKNPKISGRNTASTFQRFPVLSRRIRWFFRIFPVGSYGICPTESLTWVDKNKILSNVLINTNSFFMWYRTKTKQNDVRMTWVDDRAWNGRIFYGPAQSRPGLWPYWTDPAQCNSCRARPGPTSSSPWPARSGPTQ